MPLLVRETKEPLRLHDTSVESEQDRQVWDFDLKRDVFESDWKGVQDQLTHYRSNNNWRVVSDILSHIATIAPDKLDTYVQDSDWQAVQEQLTEIRSNNNYRCLSLPCSHV